MVGRVLASLADRRQVFVVLVVRIIDVQRGGVLLPTVGPGVRQGGVTVHGDRPEPVDLRCVRLTIHQNGVLACGCEGVVQGDRLGCGYDIPGDVHDVPYGRMDIGTCGQCYLNILLRHYIRVLRVHREQDDVRSSGDEFIFGIRGDLVSILIVPAFESLSRCCEGDLIAGVERAPSGYSDPLIRICRYVAGDIGDELQLLDEGVCYFGR